MPGVPVTLQGSVRDASTGAAADAGSVCVTSGDTALARTAVGSDGAFRLEVPDVPAGSYQVLVLVDGLEGWRRTLRVAAEPVERDLGELVLRPSELPAGIHGQAWDVVADRPVLAGRMSLLRGGQQLGNARLDIDGWFAFDLGCRRPLPPGPYALVADAPGYQDRATPLAVVERVTAYQLGRVVLWPVDTAETVADTDR